MEGLEEDSQQLKEEGSIGVLESRQRATTVMYRESDMYKSGA